MALFNAPAWMMKGKSKGATLMTISDEEFFKNRTKVACSIRFVPNTTPILRRNKSESKYILDFMVTKTGFTSDKTSVGIYLEIIYNGKWTYIDLNTKADFTKLNVNQRKDISSVVNSNKKVVEAINNAGNGGKIYIAFRTSKEVCVDQFSLNVKDV